jgi:Fanconi anemia group M protein
VDTVKKMAGKKMIVFVQYRAQISRIEDVLKENGITARMFVGKKDGVTRKIQEQTIADFRDGRFDVLVASSIGEEGLDIPAVDAVIFYEPVPSEIRSIQRRGRAARLKEGEVIVLMTKGTRDEYYYYASNNREKRMKRILSGMQKGKKMTTADKLAKTKTRSARPEARNPKPRTRDTKSRKRGLKGQTRMTDF